MAKSPPKNKKEATLVYKCGCKVFINLNISRVDIETEFAKTVNCIECFGK